MFRLSSLKKNQKYFQKKHVQTYNSVSVLYGNECPIWYKKANNIGLNNNEKALFKKDGILKPDKLPELKSFVHALLDKDPEAHVYPDVWELLLVYDTETDRLAAVDKIFSNGVNIPKQIWTLMKPLCRRMNWLKSQTQREN